MNYDISNWYWRAEDGRIFSSAQQSMVAPDDEGWLAAEADGRYTLWPRDEAGEQTDSALQWVFDNAGVSIGVTLDAFKAVLKTEIDAAAERERGRYITAGAGQAMTYQQKASEAVMLGDDPSPNPADYPLLSAEVGITAPTLTEVGAVVRQAHGQWILLGAAIESARLGAKKAVDEAEDEATARAAAEVVWPSPPG